MTGRLAGKVALITGGSRGQGEAAARSFVAEGASVVLADILDDDGKKLADELGDAARYIHLDVTDEAGWVETVAQIERELGRLDILVNNAGIFLYASVKDVALKDVDAVLNVNVRAPVVASQAAIPYLGKGGRIINIGSWFGEQVQWPGIAVYAMSKSALISLTKGLARELGPQGVTVNLVQPGAINTDMNPAHGPLADMIRQPIAVGEYGTGEDIAHAVAFLASAKAQYITGTSLTVDGGMIA